MVRPLIIRVTAVLVTVAITLTCIELFFQWNTKSQLIAKPSHIRGPELPLPLEKWGVTVDMAAAHSFDDIHKSLNEGESRDLKRLFYPTADGPPGEEQKGISHYVLEPSGREYLTTYIKSDAYGRREMPEVGTKADPRLLIFMGDSFTFGIGLNWQKTFASLTSKKLGIRGYNAGISGGGPNSTLYRMQMPRSNYFEKMQGTDATVVYTYIDLHLWRVICPSRCYVHNGQGQFSYLHEYRLENGVLVRGKKFYEGHPHLEKIYNVFHKSAFVEHFSLHWPPWISSDHIHLFMEIMKQIRAEVQARFSLKRFLIVNFPGFSHQTSRWLKKPLTEAGFEILDLSPYDLAHNYQGVSTIPGDGHPLPESHRIMSEILAKELQRPIGSIGL